MSVYQVKKIAEYISSNPYPGRGIVVGKTPSGKAAIAYFISGRSENSRNRVFKEDEKGDIFTAPFDESKVEDPSLIIYRAVASLDNHLIVTNGDQTDTAYEGLLNGQTSAAALTTREFEPDAPNFTPRISAVLTFGEGNFEYEMSILKSADAEGSACNRFFYEYQSLSGVGHFIHTYEGDGNPLPTFCGEPKRIEIPESIDDFRDEIWNNLNEQNKISLYVRYLSADGKTTETRLINKNL